MEPKVVIRQLSGQLVCALTLEELQLMSSSFGDCVRVLKRHLAQLSGESIYKLRLVGQGSQGSRVLKDQDLLMDLPEDLQMLFQAYVTPDEALRADFLRAAENGEVELLDELLSRPIDPNTLAEGDADWGPWGPRQQLRIGQMAALGPLGFPMAGRNQSAMQLASAGGHTECVRHKGRLCFITQEMPISLYTVFFFSVESPPPFVTPQVGAGSSRRIKMGVEAT